MQCGASTSVWVMGICDVMRATKGSCSSQSDMQRYNIVSNFEGWKTYPGGINYATRCHNRGFCTQYPECIFVHTRVGFIIHITLPNTWWLCPCTAGFTHVLTVSISNNLFVEVIERDHCNVKEVTSCSKASSM
jgi:hypothetical protein